MIHPDAKLRTYINKVSYVRTFPGHWPNVSEWIEVFVESYDRRNGRKEWDAVISVGFPTEMREQWNTRKTFATRDDAAAFAAAGVFCAETMIAALARGEVPFMPHRAMADACARDLGADLKLAAMTDGVESAPDHRARAERRQQLCRAREEATFAWYKAHDWRNFMPGAADKAAA